MEYRIIVSPMQETLEIVFSRANNKVDMSKVNTGSLGLIQGRMIDMIAAADIAQKAVNVTVCDVRGSCPQNMILIAILGDTSAVENAMASVKEGVKRGSANA